MGVAEQAPRAFAQPPLSRPRIAAGPWAVLAVLALGEFMILLDTTIVAVAMPRLSEDLHASLDQLLWVLNGYILVFAALLIVAGRLGDMFGPKRLFLSGLAVFTLASLACGLAQNPNELIVFRVIQAAGGAILMPQTLSVITSIFPVQKRGAAFGVWSAIAGLAAVAGPILGGVLTSGVSWRAIFFPNLLIGVVAFGLALLMMPELTAHRARRIDLVGMVLAAGGLFLLIFALVEAQKYKGGRIVNVAAFDLGPVHAGLISVPSVILASLVLLVGFVIWETYQDEPLLPLTLFGDRNFSVGNAVAMIVNFGILGMMVSLTLFLQSVRGFSAVAAGLTILPNAVATMMGAPISGRLTDKVNGKYVLFAGLSLFALGLGLVSLVASLNATGLTFTLPLCVSGLGMGFTLAPMTALAMRSIAPSAAGAASGFMNTIRQVGSVLGAGAAGAVLSTQLTDHMKSQAAQYALPLPSAYRASFVKNAANFSSEGLRVGVDQTRVALAPHLPSAVAATWKQAGTVLFNHAFVNAIHPAMIVPVVVLGLGALLSLLMRTPRLAPVPAAAPEPPREPVPAAPLRVSAPVYVSDTVVLPAMSHALAAATGRQLRLPYLVPSGNGGTATYPLKTMLSLGRMPNNDVVIGDPEVSRSHAVILRREGMTRVRDLNSANGTWVNGRRIEREEPLHNGDTVTLGDSSFIYHDDVEAARPRLVRADDGRREYPLGQGLHLGRLPSNDVVIQDPKASRRHAEVSMRDGQVVLRDLESLNGTRVNGELVFGDRALQDGDTITIGDTALIYHDDLGAGRS